MKKISIVITSFERVDMTLNSFEKVYNDERISKIVIVDDRSSDVVYNELEQKCKNLKKVNLFRNEKNLDCYANKLMAVSLSPTDYCILLDSDNQIDTEYIDRIFEQEWDWETILQPTFARPLFDFREFSGLIINKGNVSQYMDRPFFATALNAMNYFVNKEKYIEVWDGNVNPHSSDSIFQNYNWLNSGYNIHFVDGMEYSHLVHDASHYKNNCHKDPDFYQKIEENLRNMK